MRQLVRFTLRTQERLRRLLERKNVPSISNSFTSQLEKDTVLLSSVPIIDDDRRFRQFIYVNKRRFDNTTKLLMEKKVRRKVLKDVLEKQQRKFDDFHVALQERKDRLIKDVEERTEHLQDVLHEKRELLAEAEKRIVERGKFIIQDIKETKEKMREKMEEVVERENIYTIPNFLCVTRIVFSPYLGYLICTENFQYALGFMAIAAASDFLDGWIARNFANQSSKIGSFLDPMADKVLIGTLFLSLTYVHLIPVPLTVLIIMRDVALVAAGFVIRYKSLPPPRTLSRYFNATHVTAQLAPTFISKVNTGIQLGLVGVTLAAPVFHYVDHPLLQALWYLTATTTVLSAVSYVANDKTYRYLRKRKS